MCLVYCSAYGRIQVCKGDDITVVHMDAYKFVKVMVLGGISPNEVIARSEFEVHRQIVTERM